jgi:hypothetical protein
MILLFAGFMMFAMVVSLTDWRRGWLLAVVCGLLQDPARKMTPGTPVALTLSVVAIYIAVLFSAQYQLQAGWRDFTRRLSGIWAAAIVMLFFICLAAMNGLFTYGLEFWKVPALSLFIYLTPLPAILLGYVYVQREEQIAYFFKFYSAVTAIGLIGTPLEYLGVKASAIGLVGMPESYIRHLPGIQIKVLSGFYRAPDIMGWHAATLASIGIAMAMRAQVFQRAMPWLLLAGWGFFNTLISGRRKAVYMIVVFAAVVFWRYFRRLTFAQVTSMVLAVMTIFVIMRYTASSERGAVYTKGTQTSSEEIFERLEGGFIGTIETFGIMGAGLGTATQGVRHLLGHDENIGWQEGGLGKLAIEVGLPGVLAVAFVGWTLSRTLLRVTAAPDLPGSTQLMRVTLFALVVSNVANFMVSAQAYSDAVLTLMSAFFLGCLFATAVLDERYAAEQAAKAPAPAEDALAVRPRLGSPATA